MSDALTSDGEVVDAAGPAMAEWMGCDDDKVEEGGAGGGVCERA